VSISEFYMGRHIRGATHELLGHYLRNTSLLCMLLAAINILALRVSERHGCSVILPFSILAFASRPPGIARGVGRAGHEQQVPHHRSGRSVFRCRPICALPSFLSPLPPSFLSPRLPADLLVHSHYILEVFVHDCMNYVAVFVLLFFLAMEVMLTFKTLQPPKPKPE
jgi:hypothetical protein